MGITHVNCSSLFLSPCLPGEQWFSNVDDISSPGIFCQCQETFLVVTTGVVWRILLNASMYRTANKELPGPKWQMHCGLFSNIPDFYPLNTSSTLYPPILQVIRTRNISRHHQMSPEGVKLPLLRTSAFRGKHYLNSFFVISLFTQW